MMYTTLIAGGPLEEGDLVGIANDGKVYPYPLLYLVTAGEDINTGCYIRIGPDHLAYQSSADECDGAAYEDARKGEDFKVRVGQQPSPAVMRLLFGFKEPEVIPGTEFVELNPDLPEPVIIPASPSSASPSGLTPGPGSPHA